MKARTSASKRSRPTSKGRNIELAKIHMAATDRRLIQPGDDSAYRDMLWSIARVRSAADLDATGREKVLAHLRAVGWKDSKPFVRPKSGGSRSPQAGKIRQLWAALHQAGEVEDGSERALRAYVEHQSKVYHPQRAGYSAPELLPSLVAQRVIEHLKQWCQRTGVEV